MSAVSFLKETVSRLWNSLPIECFPLTYDQVIPPLSFIYMIVYIYMYIYIYIYIYYMLYI